MIKSKINNVQKDLQDQQIDGWLLYDYRRCNTLVHDFLEIPSEKKTTRRFFYWIPQKGDPIKIVPLIEPYTLDHLPGQKWTFRTWQELENMLHTFAVNNAKIAMEYSPFNALPNISKVDAGTIELIQRRGAQVVSSANILQKFTSVWSQNQLESHLFAADVLDNIVNLTWAYIEQALKNRSSLNEYQVQQFMLQKMEEAGCTTVDAPTCAVNAHSADPHYHPSSSSASPITHGDFVLLDLWCKKKASHSVYADITRVGVAAETATAKQRHIFHVVKQARDAATALVKKRFENRLPLQGWEVDQECRNVILEAGYGDFFIHRTGHNIGEEVHGPGANIDNFETHDFRQLLPGTCFSIEPGIYLPGEFGVRLEYDVYLDHGGKVMVSGGIQEELFEIISQ